MSSSTSTSTSTTQEESEYLPEQPNSILGESIHPDTVAAYEKLELPVPDTVRLASTRPYEQMKRNVTNVKKQQPKEKTRIVNMIRSKDRQKREWLCFSYMVTIEDLHGNKTRPAQYRKGSHIEPYGSIKTDLHFNRMGAELEGKNQIFDIPFDTKIVNEQIKKHIESGFIQEDINLIVGYTSNNSSEWIEQPAYAVKNIEDFRTGTFEQLMQLGQRGLSTVEPSLERLKQPVEMDPESSLFKKGKIR